MRYQGFAGASPAVHGREEVKSGGFTLNGTPEQNTLIDTAITRCGFDFGRLPKTIPVTWADLSPHNAAGLFWLDGRIQLDTGLSGQRAQSVFLAEAWHAVDTYVMTPQGRAALVAAFHGGDTDSHTWFDNGSYYADMGETMMDVFIAAYSDLPPTGLTWEHPPSPTLVGVLRDVLGGPPDSRVVDRALANTAREWVKRRRYGDSRVLRSDLLDWLRVHRIPEP